MCAKWRIDTTWLQRLTTMGWFFLRDCRVLKVAVQFSLSWVILRGCFQRFFTIINLRKSDFIVFEDALLGVVLRRWHIVHSDLKSSMSQLFRVKRKIGIRLLMPNRRLLILAKYWHVNMLALNRWPLMLGCPIIISSRFRVWRADVAIAATILNVYSLAQVVLDLDFAICTRRNKCWLGDFLTWACRALSSLDCKG